MILISCTLRQVHFKSTKHLQRARGYSDPVGCSTAALVETYYLDAIVLVNIDVCRETATTMKKTY